MKHTIKTGLDGKAVRMPFGGRYRQGKDGRVIVIPKGSVTVESTEEITVYEIEPLLPY